jgi:DNA-binding PadR family transcriptional regulator
MRYIEPDVLALLTREAKPTGQICRELYGDDYAMQASKVFYALDSLVRHGWAESRMVTLQNGRRVRYWALPGGSFPEEGPVLLVDRITDALRSGP